MRADNVLVVRAGTWTELPLAIEERVDDVIIHGARTRALLMSTVAIGGIVGRVVGVDIGIGNETVLCCCL